MQCTLPIGHLISCTKKDCVDKYLCASSEQDSNLQGLAVNFPKRCSSALPSRPIHKCALSICAGGV